MSAGVCQGAADVKEALMRRHGATGGSGEWVCVEEAFCGWRSGGGGIDLLAIGAWQTAKAPGLPQAGKREGQWPNYDGAWDATFPIVAYEVKVSRADLRRELYGYKPGEGASYRTRAVPPWPHKAHWALEKSHYFMFATPKGLLRDEEIEKRSKPEDEKGLWLPPEAGLIEVDGRGCVVRVPAPRRGCPPALTIPEVAELLRHGLDPASVRGLRQKAIYLEREVGRLQTLLDQRESVAA